MIVTATQIKFNRIFSIFHFIPMVIKVFKQLDEVDGLLFHKLRGCYTLTGWQDYESMKQFRNNGTHLDAMKHIKKIGLAKSVTWETKEQPTWDEAQKRLMDIQF